MNIAFYTGKTGLIAQQEGLNVYSNNIANVNTVGFKASRPSLADGSRRICAQHSAYVQRGCIYIYR